MADEFSELVMLTSFLGYVYGSDIKDELRAAYELEEERRRQEEQDRLAAQISAMKKRVAESGESMDTYMLLLEKRNRELESDSRRLREEIEENRRLSLEIDKLEDIRAAAERRISELMDADAQKEQHISALRKKFDDEVAVIRVQSREQVDEEKNRLNTEAVAIREEYGRLARLTREQADSKVAEIQAENDRLKEKNTLVSAQLHGIRQQHGLMTSEDDFTSRDRFEELEREYEAFLDLFEKQWKVTKRRIRKDILWSFKKKDDNDSEAR
jgi:chromosome segregation ATPase